MLQLKKEQEIVVREKMEKPLSVCLQTTFVCISQHDVISAACAPTKTKEILKILVYDYEK